MTALRIPIDDPADPRLDVFRHLKRQNATRSSGLFVLEGEKLLHGLLASRYPVAGVLVSDRREPAIVDRVPAGVPLYVLPHDQLEALVGFNFHQGVLSCARRLPPLDLEALVAAAPAGVGATLLVAPQIDNPENLGALARIADVFGVLAVLVGPRCPDPLSRRVLRVSMGTALRVPVVPSAEPLRALAALRGRFGYRLVSTVTDASAPSLESFRTDPADRLAIAFGCEAHGLSAEWLASSDHLITIPMRAGAESLNLAVAAGVVTYRLTRPTGPPAT